MTTNKNEKIENENNVKVENEKVEFVDEGMTPYKAAKIVNAALKENNIDKELPPQMFYNYTTARVRQNKKPLIGMFDEKTISTKALIEWLEKYIGKQINESE